MFSSFRLLEGCPERGWSSMLKSPFLKQENQTLAHDSELVPWKPPEAFLMIPWVFSRGGSKNSNKFFVPLNHTSRFRQGHKNYLHENWPCSRLSCYRKTSVSLLTVEGLGNKHWRCPSPTPTRSAALRLVVYAHPCMHSLNFNNYQLSNHCKLDPYVCDISDSQIPWKLDPALLTVRRSIPVHITIQ